LVLLWYPFGDGLVWVGVDVSPYTTFAQQYEVPQEIGFENWVLGACKDIRYVGIEVISNIGVIVRIGNALVSPTGVDLAPLMWKTNCPVCRIF
jgi:hypothetical protein